MSQSTRCDFPNLQVSNHPLLQHKLSILRDKSTTKKGFKELVHEITLLLAYAASQELAITQCQIETPLETMQAPILAGKKPVILPILRAGIGMVDAFLSLIPSARVGHIGLFRDETTLKPKRYYFKIPKESEDRHFFVCDPMLATGGSAIAAIDILKEEGVRNITMVCLVTAPEGVQAFFDKHPDVSLYTASLDRKLNNKGYILPGLGDAGDRLFGTQ